MVETVVDTVTCGVLSGLTMCGLLGSFFGGDFELGLAVEVDVFFSGTFVVGVFAIGSFVVVLVVVVGTVVVVVGIVVLVVLTAGLDGLGVVEEGLTGTVTGDVVEAADADAGVGVGAAGEGFGVADAVGMTLFVGFVVLVGVVEGTGVGVVDGTEAVVVVFAPDITVLTVDEALTEPMVVEEVLSVVGNVVLLGA